MVSLLVIVRGVISDLIETKIKENSIILIFKY